MKRTTTFIFLMFLIGQTNAQYLVPGNTSSGGNNIPFQDTILSSRDMWGSCSSFNYNFDLDQDSIPDLDFHLQCYMGGMGDSDKMTLTSFNDFSIHVDTSYIEHFQFIDADGQVHDTTRKRPVVRKYNLSDTIFGNQGFLATSEKLLFYSIGYYPSCVDNNIDLFLKDTSYIAFEKSNGDLYYLKIYMHSKSELEIMFAKTNAQTNDINEYKLSENNIFPNPANKVINFNKAFDFIEIYSVEGTLLMKKNLPDTQRFLDISNLKNGFYVVVLKTKGKRYITKLLKL